VSFARLALRNPIGILMAAIAVLVLGMTALSRLSVDLFPDITLPLLTVGTRYEGASPVDIERSVTYPIEKAVSGATGVDHVESRSRQGISLVDVWLRWGEDVNAAMVEVLQQVQQIAADLPDGIDQPFVVKRDLSNIPVCFIPLSGTGLDERSLYDLAYNTIAPQLEQVPGVAAVTVGGGKIRQINIELDREQAFAKGVSVLDVVEAVKEANLILPAGNIKIGPTDYNVYANTQFSLVQPMENIIVKKVGGIPIRIRDLGWVRDGAEDQTNVVKADGVRGVSLAVQKEPGANTIEVVDGVRAKLSGLVGVPSRLNLDITFDQSEYIGNAVDSLRREAFQGAFLAIVIILVFLRNFASTLIIFLAIPLSILSALILLFFTGQTLNVFTLGGLTLAVGRLVDDSIVVLENIYRHLQGGKRPLDACLDGAKEVALPVLSATATTIAVFFPVVFLSGIARLLYIPLTLTIAFALGASYIVSLTVIPALSRRLLKPEQEYRLDSPRWGERVYALSQQFFTRLDRLYEQTLTRALAHRFWVITSILGFFFLSLLLLPFIGREFFPESDESQFRIYVRAPIGTRVEETEKILDRMEQITRKGIPAGLIRTVLTDIGTRTRGRAAVFGQNSGPHMGRLSVYLTSSAQRPESSSVMMDRVREKMVGRVPGTLIYLSTGGITRFIMNFGSEEPIDVEVVGYDLQQGRLLAGEVAGLMRSVLGLTDVRIDREDNYPEYRIIVDREKAGELGLSEKEAAEAVLTSLTGSIHSPSVFTDPISGNEYDILVRLQAPFRSQAEDLGKVFLTVPSTELRTGDGGKPVSLGNFAHVERRVGPIEIRRKYQDRVIHIYANPTGRDLGSLAAELEEKFRRLVLPTGFSLRLSGQIAQQRGAFASLFFAAALAVLLVYMILAAQFKSLLDPFLIMFTVPLGFAGVVWALFLTGTTFSVTSLMGVIMMVGIVVSNGVLLVDYTNQLRERGEALLVAVIQAGKTRLRPILMTTLTTIGGLFPMTLGLDVGSEANAPLARAVVGGLGLSTVLTLFLLPVLYTVVEERFPGRKTREPFNVSSDLG
jgi:CzcA family heavy metal efflux pump